MSETSTIDNDNDLDNHFDKIIEMQARSRALEMIENSEANNLQTSQEHSSKITLTRRGKVAFAALEIALATGLGIGIGAAMHEATRPNLVVSEETKIVTGDSVWDIATNQVKGASEVNIRDLVEEIESNPANTEAFKGGLKANEPVKVPVSVKPR